MTYTNNQEVLNNIHKALEAAKRRGISSEEIKTRATHALETFTLVEEERVALEQLIQPEHNSTYPRPQE